MTRRQLTVALLLFAASASSACAADETPVTHPTPLAAPAPSPQPQPQAQAVEAAPVEERSFQEKAGSAFQSFRKGMAELGRSLTDF